MKLSVFQFKIQSIDIQFHPSDIIFFANQGLIAVKNHTRNILVMISNHLIDFREYLYVEYQKSINDIINVIINVFCLNHISDGYITFIISQSHRYVKIHT